MSGSFKPMSLNACVHRLDLFELSSERVLGGIRMESEPMLTPTEKSPLLEKFSPEDMTLHQAGQ